MSCPHYSREENDCLLAQEPLQDAEEPTLPPADELPSRDRCLSPGGAYRDCPVFRRFLNELLPGGSYPAPP
jgi:hypothetical protein